MSFLAKLMPAKTAITSATIKTEIANAESEIASHHDKLSGALAGIALMSDSEHQKAETDIAATKRAIARLEARVIHLTDELPRVIANEEAAAAAAADAALRQRAEAARKANTVEAKKLLTEYDKLAAQMANVLQGLKDAADEANAVNVELSKNPVADGVVTYDGTHRYTPGEIIPAQKEMRHVWVANDSARGVIMERTASLDAGGNPIPHRVVEYDGHGRPMQWRLERREVVVSGSHRRHARHETGLSSIHLPPGFLGGTAHWPRRS